MLVWAYNRKQEMLGTQLYHWYSDETIQALKNYVTETAHDQRSHIISYRHDVLGIIVNSKIWRLARPETNVTAEMFLDVQTELTEYFKTVESPFPKIYIANNFVRVATELYDRRVHDQSVITEEQFLAAFQTVIAILKEAPEPYEGYSQRTRIDLEIKLAILQAEGKTPAIAGTDINGQPFDWNTFRGKTVLMAFTSSWYGGREMQDMLELVESFSGHELEYVTYVALNGKENNVDDAQEKRWLDLCIEKLDYPGTILTQIESPEPVIQGIAHWLGERRYDTQRPHFMLVDRNGQIIELGRIDEIRAKLTERFDVPLDEAVARGVERSRAYSTTPKPCVSNFRGLALAVHLYYDTHKTMPPAYTIDENGNKLHSWRVLLLPYLGYEELYSQIRLDEPWDSEHNKRISETIVPVFQCHLTAFGSNPQPVTNYAAIVGREGVFEENGKQISFGLLLKSVIPIMVVES